MSIFFIYIFFVFIFTQQNAQDIALVCYYSLDVFNFISATDNPGPKTLFMIKYCFYPKIIQIFCTEFMVEQYTVLL